MILKVKKKIGINIFKEEYRERRNDFERGKKKRGKKVNILKE